MKTSILAASLVLLASTSFVSAADRLSFLKSPNMEAINYFGCASVIGRLRSDLKDAGFDTMTGLPEVYDAAGTAAVARAALMTPETNGGQLASNVSFTSRKTERLVAQDVAWHRGRAKQAVMRGTFETAATKLTACLDPSFEERAKRDADWFRRDVSLFRSLSK